LATWWLGAIGGAVLVWRAGGGGGDLLCGLLAGIVLGLAGGATLGCVLVLIDELPRRLRAAMPSADAVGPGVAAPLWLFTALLCWAAVGAGVGLVLGALGDRGVSLLAAVTGRLAGLLRRVGLERAAGFFALRGG